MLDVGARDSILEVGCGHGVAATLVCERLGDGHPTAIDRSSRMIAAATRRNRVHVDAGRVTFEIASFEDADFGSARFDQVFAVHVATFYRPPAPALPIARELLVPGRKLAVFSQGPGWDEARAFAFAEEATGLLGAARLRDTTRVVAELESGWAAGYRDGARPPQRGRRESAGSARAFRS